ncbi:hypothetical protein EOD39_6720 [Acipenser ruthenus]|uniref:Uncharacterized protein n=1 Tax=Acipenser ruthenus TaxID=7906 RepID=A0A444U9A6_ACIRT|nr:hypothetical protein EOD39_6720 [Acipenser ruthenus]
MGALKRFGDSQSYLALQDHLQRLWRAPGEKLGALAADIARRINPMNIHTKLLKFYLLQTYLLSTHPPWMYLARILLLKCELKLHLL